MTLVRKLTLGCEPTTQAVSDLHELEPTEPQREELGVWAVSGRDTGSVGSASSSTTRTTASS